jgi:hypothetical protein
MKYKIQFTTIKKQPDKYGNNFVISKIKLMDENGKYIKFAKLNEVMLDVLKETIFEIEL